MSTHQGQIPGLFASDKGMDWTEDRLNQDQNPSEDANRDGTGHGQNNSMHLARADKDILNELHREKEGIGANFLHCHRLLDGGEIPILINAHCIVISFFTFFIVMISEISKVQYGGSSTSELDPDMRLSEKIYVSMIHQKQV